MRNVYHNSHIYFATCVGLYLTNYAIYIYLPSELTQLRTIMSTVMLVLLLLSMVAALGFIFKPAGKLQTTTEKGSLTRGKVKENTKTRKR